MNFTPKHFTPPEGASPRRPAHNPGPNARRPCCRSSQIPKPSRLKDSTEPSNFRIRKIAPSPVRNGKDGLAFAHCLRSSGLQSLSADNSTYNTSESSPDNAASRLDVKTSPGSAGRGGVPIINTRPLGAAIVAGTMSSMAFSVRICASSNTRTSTFAKPRPKPCSRAPNSTREPLANSTASVPAPVNTRRTNGFTSGSSAIDPIDLNVSLCVRDRCADHSTSVSGFAKHNANAKAPNVYVFPA